MKDNKEKARGGFPIVGILGLIFITLKLCGVIDWAWIWVLAPFWGVLALTIAIFIIIAVIYMIAELIK